MKTVDHELAAFLTGIVPNNLYVDTEAIAKKNGIRFWRNSLRDLNPKMISMKWTKP
jgi:hypothetical protein